MTMFRVALLAAAAILLPGQALAQSEVADSSIIRMSVTAPNLFHANAEAAPPAQAGRTALPGRGYYLKAFGGGWLSAGEGFLLGGGASFLPFTNKQHEVGANVSYLRVEGSNGLMFEGNYNYNFNMQNGAFIPFATGGINTYHFGGPEGCGDIEDIFDVDIDCSTTEAGLQIGGGIKRPLAGNREFFGEILFAFSHGDPIILRAGLSW
jgi:hypothetical protein